MNEEELNRKMEFIVEQQAQFVVDIHKLEENQRGLQEVQKDLATRHAILAEALAAVVAMVGRLSQGQEELRAEMKELASAQKRTDERLAESNERLNVFIEVLERYIGEGRNGRTAPEN